eukprot:TRINITY_DN7049_c1_g1_i1.p1 TRINITY_DN7049_c1_g1~~TRINITY_DN7049_c1_g1_i1.p1  ORF type:complete len:582 (+),score=110.88 TRINITY_DN7049_c1_g1_i1:88-1833(+)
MGADSSDKLLEKLQGEWRDVKGNTWGVEDTDVHFSNSSGSKNQLYAIRKVGTSWMLNGVKLKSVGGTILWSSSPTPGGGTTWYPEKGTATDEHPPKRWQPEEDETNYQLEKLTDVESIMVDTSPTVDYPLLKLSYDSLSHTPLRLTEQDRRGLRVIKAAMLQSDYTDVVDSQPDGPARQKQKVKALKHIMSGLHVAHCKKLERALVSLQNREESDDLLHTTTRLLEIARRYKIASPNTGMEDYGKLLYVAQDFYEMHDDPPERIKTVKDALEELGMTKMLEDKRIPVATTPVPRIRDIRQLNRALKNKSATQKELFRQYGSKVEQIIYSIDDRNVFIEQNAIPINEMIELCKKYFDPRRVTEDTSLAITEGVEGSRISHEHESQYYYVLQSLAFWKNILQEMSWLWVVMETDMLSGSPYEFRETGQGLNRVHNCPDLFNAVSSILDKTKAEVGTWVGSSRIHMGDNQVPNGLHFIDKYTQVSKIIRPILSTIHGISRVCDSDPVQRDVMLEQWGSVSNLQLAILRDFFRHGFDGSGGNNNDDAGSCIDGRLTSAWNWCSQLRNKPFYSAFLLSGFTSFDRT